MSARTPKATRPHMPGYGLPDGDAGLMPWSWAQERLESGHGYWLATVRPDGRPHLMVIWGLWHQGAFYFSTGRESRKARNLESNARCVIGTERNGQAVIVEGTAAKLADIALLTQLLSIYERKYDYDMPAMKQDILTLREPIYVIQPAVAFGIDEQASLGTATRWRFD